jgi:hypothetical protein
MIEQAIIYFRYFLGRACREAADKNFGEVRVYLLMSTVGACLAWGILASAWVALGRNINSMNEVGTVLVVLVACLLAHMRYLSSEALIRKYYRKFDTYSAAKRRLADVATGALSLAAVAFPFVLLHWQSHRIR